MQILQTGANKNQDMSQISYVSVRLQLDSLVSVEHSLGQLLMLNERLFVIENLMSTNKHLSEICF